MRSPRYVDERLAREAILFDRPFHADTRQTKWTWLSDQLIVNLEKHWNARQRKL
jgi:hypothetical protein